MSGALDGTAEGSEAVVSPARLPPGGCGVWWAPLGVVDAASWHLLSDQERARALRHHRLEDQARSAGGAALLRSVVGGMTGIAAGELTVVRRCARCGGPHGRPELPGTGLHASISHAGNWVLVAVTRAGPVGVDIEPASGPGSSRKWGWLRARVVGSSEAARLRPDDNPLVVWTRKEAVLKATGEGLTTPMPDVVVTPPSQPPALLHHARRPGLACRLSDLVSIDGYAGAVAVLTSARDVAVEEHVLPATAL
jgi:4'-phosphopantetheinyl transferase